nr:ash family protein [Klebsiella pneumoniae]
MCHSDRASAKSDAGIGLPVNVTAHNTRLRVFLCIRFSVPIQWWAGRGSARTPVPCDAGKTNSVQFTTKSDWSLWW